MSRYINADNILYKDLSEGRGVCWVTFRDWIKEMPTADVRENVRGEWLPMKRFGGEKGQTPDVMCSVCHAPALWLGTLGCIRSNYCPNCGADMRGDNNEMDSMQRKVAGKRENRK